MSRYLLELQAVDQRVKSVVVFVVGQQLLELVLLLLVVVLLMVLILVLMRLLIHDMLNVLGRHRTAESHAIVIVVRLVDMVTLVGVRIAAAARLAEIAASPGVRIEVNVLDGARSIVISIADDGLWICCRRVVVVVVVVCRRGACELQSSCV